MQTDSLTLCLHFVFFSPAFAIDEIIKGNICQPLNGDFWKLFNLNVKSDQKYYGNNFNLNGGLNDEFITKTPSLRPFNS